MKTDEPEPEMWSTSPPDWPSPTPEMLATKEFVAIWQAIRSWDIAVPWAYKGYCGATGNHVRAILDSLEKERSKRDEPR